MFIIYSLFFLILNFTLDKKIKSETYKITFIVFSLLSPLVIFLDNLIPYEGYLEFFKISFTSKVLFIIYFLISGLYWLIKLIKNNQVHLPVIKTESLFFLSLFVTNVNLKLFLLLIFLCIRIYESKESLDILKTRYFFSLIFVIATFLISIIPPLVSFVLLFSLLAIFIINNKSDLLDYYHLIFSIACLDGLGVMNQTYTIILYIFVLFAIFRFRIEVSDKEKIKTLIFNSTPTELVLNKFSSVANSTFNIQMRASNNLFNLKNITISLKEEISLENSLSSLSLMVLFFAVLLFISIGWFNW